MLRSVARCIARCSGVPPTPNNCSKSTRGSRTIGSGVSGADQLIVSVYTQAYPYAHPPDWSTGSMLICIEGIGVSLPNR